MFVYFYMTQRFSRIVGTFPNLFDKVYFAWRIYWPLQEEEGNKKSEVDNNKRILMEHRERLMQMIETCKALHEGFDDRRLDVRAEKQKKIRELTDPNHAWDAPEPESPSFDDFGSSAMAPAAAADVSTVGGEAAVRVGYLQYRALYDYEARNEDELSFQTNDIILVHPEQEHEPGWLGGELNGKIGWFPEAYAQQLGENGQPVVAAEPSLQTIAEVSETSSDKGSLQDQGMLQDVVGDQPTTADTEPSSTESAVAEAAAPPAADEAAAEPEAAPAEAVEEPVSEPTAADVTLTTQQSVTSQQEEPAAIDTTAAVEQPEAAVATDVEELNEEFVALYAYQSGEPGDLIFEAGEKIIVTK